jgi:hypothetical protein
MRKNAKPRTSSTQHAGRGTNSLTHSLTCSCARVLLNANGLGGVRCLIQHVMDAFVRRGSAARHEPHNSGEKALCCNSNHLC